MDKIFVKNLLVRGIVGINDWEREQQQDILVNLTLFSDIRESGKTDKIEDTLNYRTITKEIINYIQGSEHFLVEALASEIAKICVVKFNASKVIVRIEKPMALRFADSVGVEIEREKGDY